jgi:hypothetical protein
MASSLAGSAVTLPLDIRSAVTSASVEVEVAHVQLNLLLGKFVLGSLELDKFFAVDDGAASRTSATG